MRKFGLFSKRHQMQSSTAIYTWGGGGRHNSDASFVADRRPFDQFMIAFLAGQLVTVYESFDASKISN